MRNNHARTATLLGSPMVFKNANPPTDIIWENKEPQNTFLKQSKVWIVLFFLMLCQFMVVFKISEYEQAIADMFPQVDCDFISDMYGQKL